MNSPEGIQMKLTEACINKPVFAWMLMAGTVLFGLVAASRIGISQMPDVDFPTINVSVSWEGAAPEVIENDVLQPLEEALVQVEGVAGLTSTARQGGGSVTVELNLSRNVDLALQDVTAKVQQAARRLPRDIDPPVISKSNPEDQPIMWIGLTGPYPRQVIADYARYRVKERLQTVPGIGEITEGGSIERNVRIWVDSSALDARNLTVGDITRALVREHVELPAGRIEVPGREVNVRVLGEAMDLETLRNIVVAESGSPPPRSTGGMERAEPRSISRTWRSSRTASRTSAGSRASTVSRRRASGSASSAVPTPSPWRGRSAPRWPRSARPCRPV